MRNGEVQLLLNDVDWSLLLEVVKRRERMRKKDREMIVREGLRRGRERQFRERERENSVEGREGRFRERERKDSVEGRER